MDSFDFEKKLVLQELQLFTFLQDGNPLTIPFRMLDRILSYRHSDARWQGRLAKAETDSDSDTDTDSAD